MPVTLHYAVSQSDHRIPNLIRPSPLLDCDFIFRLDGVSDHAGRNLEREVRATLGHCFGVFLHSVKEPPAHHCIPAGRNKVRAIAIADIAVFAASSLRAIFKREMVNSKLFFQFLGLRVIRGHAGVGKNCTRKIRICAQKFERLNALLKKLAHSLLPIRIVTAPLAF